MSILAPTLPEPVINYRDELKHLERIHYDGCSGSAVMEGITAATDTLLLDILREKLRELGLNESRISSQMCLVALGGYGRKEMHPQSDIDVMFLFHEGPDKDGENLVSRMLHALYDAHLQIGNVTRDFASARAMARDDLESLTAMLEGRLIWGDLRHYESFYKQLTKYVASNSKRLINEKIIERDERLKRYGNTINVQEPNLKDSPGGLRDYHHGLWLASFQKGRKLNLTELYRAGKIYDRQYRALGIALDFLWRLRTELHFLVGRKSDLVSIELQHELANHLNYKDRENRFAEEILMRDYYRAALVVQEFADHMSAQTTYQPIWERWFQRVRKLDLGDGFVLQGTEIDTPWDLHFFDNAPQRLLDAFTYAVKYRATLTQSAAAAIHENRKLVDEKFRQQPETAQKIRMIFHWPGRIVRVLRIMRRLGILHRLFPEWRGIANLVRHDLHHRYTVDEHTLLGLHYLETLHEDDLPFTDERVAMWQRLPNRDVLRLAMLCHDIGKGRGGDHCKIGADLADVIAERLRFSNQERADIRFLVSRHLVLSKTALRHDLTDPDVITNFAERVGNAKRLDLLYLLTYADIKAVTEDSLNEWKNHLLTQLYVSVQKVLAGESLEGPAAGSVIERTTEVFKELSQYFPEETVRHHLELLPENYPKFQSTEMIREHLNLIEQFDGKIPAIGFISGFDDGLLRIAVVARDRLGLFNRMATAIMLENFSIFAARLNTRDDGIVCNNLIISDVVKAAPIDEMRMQMLRERLQRILMQDGPLPSIPRDRFGPQPKRSNFEPEIDIYPDASGRCSVVDVCAVDRSGLLQDISSVISEMGMNIRLARLSTEGSRAVDVFYVTDTDGKRISDPERRHELAKRIREKL